MLATFCVAIATALALVAATGAQGARVSPRNARAVGTFTMHGAVTVAVNVRGERRGEQVWRRWLINALDCHGGSVCSRLFVTRNRGRVRGSFAILHRVGPGEYRGHGAFWTPLRCLGRTHRLGSRAPYTLTLTVTRSRRIGSVRYATAVRATYINPARSDNTRCPLGPAHDAARYRGRLTSRLPKPPPYAIKRKR